MVRKICMRGFTVFICLFVLTHYTSLFLESDRLLTFVSIFGLAALFFALFILRGKAVLLPLGLISAAMLIGIFSPDAHVVVVFWEGAREMRALISMLLVIPIVGWVLKQENYIEDTIILLKNWLSKSKTFYAMIMFVTQLISFFLLVGSVAVVYQMVQTFFSKKDDYTWQVFKATPILRGFALALLWVISIPSFAFSVEVLDVPLAVAVAQGFCLSFAGLLLAVLYLHVFEKREKVSFSRDIREVIAKEAEKVTKRDQLYRNPIEFVFLFVSMLTLMMIANTFMPFGLLTVIPIVVVVWALAYFIMKRKLPALIQESTNYVAKGMAFRAQEMSILSAAGVLIVALHSSGLSESLMQHVYQWTESVPGLNFLWVLPLIVLFFGFFGMGPLTVMVLIAGIVQSIDLPYPTELILLTMTIGSSLSVLFSPLIMPSILLSSMNGLGSFVNSFKNNWAFAIGLYFLVEMYIQLRIL